MEVFYLSVNCNQHYDLKNNVSYRHKTGKLLAHRIGQSYTELGYHTWINPGQSNGVDLKVWNRNWNLDIVAEILNWSQTTKLNVHRKASIIRNLSDYRCNKLLIYTAMGNEYTLRDLVPEGISTLKIGFQIVARYYYRKLSADQVVGRKVDSKETKELLKSKLKEYLQSLHT